MPDSAAMLKPAPELDPRPDLRLAFDHLARGHSVGDADPLATMRRFVDRYGDVSPREPITGVEVTPCEAAGVRAEWVVAPGADTRRRIVFVHGGAWVAGGLESHRPLAAELARGSGCAVLLVDYRLAPEHPFPAAFEDACAVLAWARAHGPSGADPAARLTLVGDSAGGNLAAAACADAVARGLASPDRLALVCPALDGARRAERGRGAGDGADAEGLEGTMALYLQGVATAEDPRVSPLRTNAEVLSRFPPTLLQASGAEFLLWDSQAMAERLAAAGARVTLSVWPGLPHVWHAFLTLLPEAKAAMAELAAFLAADEDGSSR